MIDWLFEIDAIRISTKDTTYSAQSYDGRVPSDSFSGVSLRWDISGGGLIAPADLRFEVSNIDGAYSSSDFNGQICTVRLVEDGTQIRAWKFRIESAVEHYEKITCSCADFLSAYLSGDYPNTPAPTEVWSSDSDTSSDDYCVPVTFGTAYIPVRSVNTGTERFYVLGESGPTYTIYEVGTPREWPANVTWDAASYTMSGSVSSGYQLLQPIIMDSDGSGTADAPGLWVSGRSFFDMLCRFKRSDTENITNPADVIQYVLEDFGVSASDIDSASFAAAKAGYTADSIGFDGGGWWEKTSRETVLSELLGHVDSYLVVSDTIELHRFEAAAVETVTNALSLSFTPESVAPTDADSGRVHWSESYTSPSDVLNGQAIVPTHSGGSEDSPSSDILACRFFLGGSINAQKAGILYFQKKYEQSKRVTFSSVLTELTVKTTMAPGQVVAVNNSQYGGAFDAIITGITIRHDLRVDISGTILNYLEDWGDLTTQAVNIAEDTSGGERLATTDYTGSISANWSDLIDIPDRFKETATLGLNATDEYFGYFDGIDFITYLDSNGNARLGAPDTGEGIAWNQGTGALTVKGSIIVENPSTVRSTLNVEDGATVGADWNSNISNKPSLGNMAYEDLVEFAKLGTSVVTGGYIKTSLLDVNNIIATGSILVTSAVGGLAYRNDVGNAQITDVTGPKITTGSITSVGGDVVFNLDTGAISFTASGRLYFGSSYMWGNSSQIRLATGTYGIASTTSYVELDGGSTVIRFSGGTFGSTAANNISLGSLGAQFNTTFTGTVRTSGILSFQNSNFTMQQTGSILQPNANLGADVGSTTNRWNWIRCGAVNTLTTNYYDIMDDLNALHKMKPDKAGKINLLTLPWELLDFESARAQLKRDLQSPFMLATDEDIELLLLDWEEAGWLVGLNLKEFTALNAGAAKQTDMQHSEVSSETLEWLSQVDWLVKELIDWTTDNMKRIKKLEEDNG